MLTVMPERAALNTAKKELEGVASRRVARNTDVGHRGGYLGT